MNYSIKRISLDIHDTSSRETVYVKRGDTGREIHITLADGGRPYQISTDCFVVFNGKKPDGTVLFNDCKIENNVIIYKLTEQTVVVEGLVKCEVSLYDFSGDLITSPRFNLSVSPKVYNDDDEVSSSDEFNALKELMKRLQELLDSLDAATIATKLVSAAIAGYVIQEASGEVITLTEAEKMPIASMRIFGKTTQEGAPTPEAPVALVSSSVDDNLTVHVCGKNLFTGWIMGGVNPDTGADYVVATQRRTAYVPIFEPGQKYSVSLIPNTLYNFAAFYDADKKYISRTVAGPSGGRLVEPPENARYFRLSIYENPDATGKIAEADDMESQTMIEAGDTVTEYESGALQTAVIFTPGGLHGLPVSSGGSYKDQNGQRWLCDEIDLFEGKRMQRVIRASDLTWTVAENNGYPVGDSLLFRCSFSAELGNTTIRHRAALCNKLPYDRACFNNNITGFYFSYGTAYARIQGVYDADTFNSLMEGAELLIQLDGPIETELDAETISAYEALRTYRRYTVVSNDGWAYMELAYLMDTKKYIASLISDGTYVPGSTVRLGNVTLYASKWVGSSSPYSQVVSVSGVTEYSQVDLKPSVEQLSIFHKKDLAFVTENDGGTVTVYAVGDKPTNDYTMQVSITEVNV